jgi:hypothetical protein
MVSLLYSILSPTYQYLISSCQVTQRSIDTHTLAMEILQQVVHTQSTEQQVQRASLALRVK